MVFKGGHRAVLNGELEVAGLGHKGNVDELVLRQVGGLQFEDLVVVPALQHALGRVLLVQQNRRFVDRRVVRSGIHLLSVVVQGEN